MKHPRESPPDVMVTTFSDQLALLSIAAADLLRDRGLQVELYPEADKLGKQLLHAEATGIDWVVFIGPFEAKDEVVSLKRISSGGQWSMSLSEAADFIIAHPPNERP